MKSFTIEYRNGEPVKISVDGSEFVPFDEDTLTAFNKYMKHCKAVTGYENIIENLSRERNNLLSDISLAVGLKIKGTK